MDIDALTVDELQSSLIVHEQKFQRRNGGQEQVLQVSIEGGRGRGRVAYRGRGRGRGRTTFNKATVECYQFLFLFLDRKSTRLNSSHYSRSRMPSSA